MGLINLLTNPKDFIFYKGKGYPGDGSKTGMTDIPYGNDQPDGGSSNQPYIQTDIPDNSSPLNGGTNDDFLLRGGINAPLDAAKDVLRLSKFFTDTRSPNGLFFILKQNLLSRTSVRTQASTGPSYGGAEGGVNQGIYTPLNTLAQVGVGFTGTHLNLLGLDPSSPMSGVVNGGLFPNLGLNGYSDVVKFSQDAKNNRLAALYQLVTDNRSVNNWNFSGLDLNVGNNILRYSGGPEAILGIGKTNIPFADQRTGLNNPNINPPEKTIFTVEKEGDSAIIRTNFTSFIIPPREKINYSKTLGVSKKYLDYFTLPIETINNIFPLIYNRDLIRYDSVYKTGSLTPTDDDNKFGTGSWTPSFQDPIGPNSSTTYIQTPNYSNKNIEKRVNIGGKDNLGPGGTGKNNLKSYTLGSGIGPIDKINALPLYPSTGPDGEKPIND